MRTATIFVKFAYALGIVVDAYSVLDLARIWRMRIPEAFSAPAAPLAGFYPEISYAAAIALSLMAGWTFLLIWGMAEPIGRRIVLLLTACPVMLLLVGGRIAAIALDKVLIKDNVILMGIQVSMGAVFLAGFFVAGKLSGDQTHYGA